ncbi:MAG: hypothetical protein ACRC8S_02305 [Fimbriiglobus sp.]
MDYIGIVILGAVILTGIWFINRLMSKSSRNDDTTHGGGHGGAASGI